MHLSQLTTATLIAALAISPTLAAGKKNKDKHDATASIKKKLSAAELPADVREKANKVVADDAPKLNAAQAKVGPKRSEGLRHQAQAGSNFGRSRHEAHVGAKIQAVLRRKRIKIGPSRPSKRPPSRPDF
jgi:hypothetical protein